MKNELNTLVIRYEILLQKGEKILEQMELSGQNTFINYIIQKAINSIWEFVIKDLKALYDKSPNDSQSKIHKTK